MQMWFQIILCARGCICRACISPVCGCQRYAKVALSKRMPAAVGCWETEGKGINTEHHTLRLLSLLHTTQVVLQSSQTITQHNTT